MVPGNMARPGQTVGSWEKPWKRNKKMKWMYGTQKVTGVSGWGRSEMAHRSQESRG